jgi:5'-deoxynucleotidase YfbR-like HD superfamily hydrolase
MQQTESCITTVSGRFFDLLRPEEYEFDVEEIATALSNICRYTGHVNSFYSVAEHSVLVSRLLPSNLALCGLLHDSSEAFVGDVSSPLKRLMPQYQEIEERVQRAIAGYYNLPYPFPEAVHEADKRMYWQERQEVANNGVRDKLWHQDLRATRKVAAKGMTPTMARRMFLTEFNKLSSFAADNKKENRLGRTEERAAGHGCDQLYRREHRDVDGRGVLDELHQVPPKGAARG